MNTQKVAITIPADLVVMIDDISKNQGLSRSKYISIVLQEKISNEKKQQIKDSYNRVFSDDTIKKEQLQTAIWFDGTGNQGGQEW
jgi:metal-responsive CopG/Arc/MetJ family transcriptional regulator